MSRASATRPSGARRQRWIPLLALAPLLALMAADAVMATLAARSDPGLVADAPRRIGLARVAPEATLRLELAFAAAEAPPAAGSPRAHALRIMLIDHAGERVEEAAVEGRLERTTHAAADRPLRFERQAPGLWTARLAPPDAGTWQVSVAARDAQGRSGLAVVRLPP